MQADLVREAAFDFADLQNVDEEFSQLESLFLQGFETVSAFEVAFVVVSHHRRAASGWAHDILILSEDFEKPFGERAGLLGQSCVGHRLPAAGLLCWNDDVTAVAFQQVNSSQTDVRVELIDIAGDKKCDLHGAG